MSMELMPLGFRDVDIVRKVYGDESIKQNAIFNGSLLKSDSEVKLAINLWLTSDDQKHFVVLHGEEKIGLGQIFNICLINSKCNLGIMILPDFQSKSIGRWVLNELIGICFDQIKLNKIEVEVVDYNEKSMRLIKPACFQLEGTLRESVFKEGRYHSLCVYGLLKKDYCK